MSARSKARKRALDVLYEADIRGLQPLDVLTTHEAQADQPMNPYTRELVEGVAAHSARIDELLSTYAQEWSLERMPAVDRNVLRLGAWEVLWGDVPAPVALSESVTLVTSLSTEESGPFVNGLLARIAQVKPRLVLD
jgi:transcription antitermination protein NusB